MRHAVLNGIRLCALLVWGLAMSTHGHAASVETLLMPGKVSAAHEKQEEDCSNCHDRADRSRQASLCLACHKDVATDVRSKQGFHGRIPNIDRGQCSGCHSEHHGREADIVKLSRAAFDHARTDFPLMGAHATVDCSSCHAERKKFREAPATCYACHRQVEPHEGKLGKECQTCHDETSWPTARYDHDKTRFPLRNAHARIACDSCHFGNRYAGTPQQCDSCHAPDDVHRGSRGTDCGKCHTTVEWRTAKFNHAKETDFPLLGEHANVACQACHKSGRMEDEIPRTCVGCHRADDHHAGRLGEDCGQCHGNDRWHDTKFDHDRDTKFALAGAHIHVECHVCHTAAVAKQKLPHDCNGCHRAEDVHAGSLGTDCAQCHDSVHWRGDVNFDHDLTEFPLLGLHAIVPCEQCHATRAYSKAAKTCIGCHAADDVHKRGLGEECASCHSPNGWSIWEFDHKKEANFALVGAHAKLSCAGCHRQPPKEVKLATDCAGCHSQDDVHLGQFGQQCQRCHSQTTFKGARLK